MSQDARDPLQPRPDVDGFQDFLFFVGRRVHVGRHHIGELRRRIDRLHRRQQFRRRLRQELDGLHRLSFQMEEARLDFGRRRPRLGNPQHPRDKKRPAGEKFSDLEPLLALTHQMVRAVRRGDVTRDIGDRPHPMHVDRIGIGRLGVALHEDADRPLFAHRLLGRHHRARASDRDRQHHPREQHGLAHRNDDDGIRRQWAHRRRRLVAPLVGRAGFSGLNQGKPPISAAR